MDKSRKSQESKPTRGSGPRARGEGPGAVARDGRKAGGDRRRSRAAPRYLLTKVPASTEEPGALTLRRTGSVEDPPAANRTRTEKLPGTLCELLARARAKCDAGVPQANIVHWVYDVAHKLEIRVRHDEYVRRGAGAQRPAIHRQGLSGEEASGEPGARADPKGETDDHPSGAETPESEENRADPLPEKHGDADAADGTADGHGSDWLVNAPDSGVPGPTGAANHDASQALALESDSRADGVDGDFAPPCRPAPPSDSADTSRDDSPPENTDDVAPPGASPRERRPARNEAALGKPQPEADQTSASPPQGTAAAKHKKGRAIPAPMTVNRGARRLSLFALLNPNAESPPQDSGENKTMVGRLILSSARRGAKSAARLCSESSGVVIDARTWRVLSLPPRAFCSQPATKDLDRMLGDGLFDVIPVDDGTVLTLYAWDHPVEGHIWCLASSNGYDVSTLKWMGPLSYAEVFADLAKRLYPEFAKASGMSLVVGPGGAARLAFTALDASKCYTVGLRHHNFHPLREDPERMWQIQHALLADDSPILCYGVGGLPGIPLQKKFANSLAPRTVAELLQRTHGALDRAKAHIGAVQRRANESPALGGESPDEAQKGEGGPANDKADALCYGFILRSTDVSRTGSQSDVLIESDLLKSVRRLAYDKAPRQFRDQLTCLSRLEYNAIRAFLTPEDRKTFLALYPAWKARFHAYDAFVRNVIRQTIHHLRVKSMQLDSPKASPVSTKTELIAQEMAAHILRSDPVQPFSQDVEKVVADYVMDPRYTSWYLLALSTAPSETRPAALDQPTH